MFKLPDEPRFCPLMDADSCLSPDGTDAWSRLKDQGTALLKAGLYREAADRYQEAERVALSMTAQVQPLICGTLHPRSSSPLRMLAAEPHLLEIIIRLVHTRVQHARFGERLDIVAAPRAGRDSNGSTKRFGEYVPTGQRSDHPENYPLRWSRGTVQPGLYWDAATGGTLMTELGQPEGFALPNKNAAICASNAAAAYLKLGVVEAAEDALRCGLRAIAYACEYPKGHHRVLCAVKAGARGNFPRDDNPEKEIQDQLDFFRKLRTAQTEGLEAYGALLSDDDDAERERKMLAMEDVLAKLPNGFDVNSSIAECEALLTQAECEAILTKMNPVSTGATIANELVQQARGIEQGAALLPSLEVALFSAGRISYPHLQARLRWKERTYLQLEQPETISISFSLVPANVDGLVASG